MMVGGVRVAHYETIKSHLEKGAQRLGENGVKPK